MMEQVGLTVVGGELTVGGCTGEHTIIGVVNIEDKGWEGKEASSLVGDEGTPLAVAASMWAHRKESHVEVGHVKNIGELDRFVSQGGWAGLYLGLHSQLIVSLFAMVT
jgi:hypothetical protein